MINICSFDGCGQEIVSRRMCRHHYNAWYRQHGREQKAASGRDVLAQAAIPPFVPANSSEQFWIDCNGYKSPSPGQLWAKRLLCKYYEQTRGRKTQLAEAIGISYSQVLEIVRYEYGHIPSLPIAGKILSFLEARVKTIDSASQS